MPLLCVLALKISFLAISFAYIIHLHKDKPFFLSIFSTGILKNALQTHSGAKLETIDMICSPYTNYYTLF